ncbi:HlyD family secretion protein [Brevibacillus laterosporus]|uniref:HlyD family secretion protein n=1 Tax=Brevibacillus laterosporus TaxID=1465 RepID=UPI003D21FA19
MRGNKKMMVGLVGLVAAIVLLGGYLLFSEQNSYAGGSAKQVTAVVEGTEVDLAFKVPGTIDKIEIKEGDIVVEGQLLAVLGSDEITAKRDQAAAAYQLAQAKLEQAKKGVSITSGSSDATVKQAQAALQAAQANLQANKNGARPEEIVQLKGKLQATKTARDLAQTNMKRMQDLLKEGAIPKIKLEESQAEFEKYSAEYTSTQEQLNMAQKGARPEQIEALTAQVNQANAAYQNAIAGLGQVGLRESDVKSAEAGVKQAKGALDEAEAYLRNTQMIAPVSGVVKSISSQKGELVAQGSSIMTIQVENDKFVKMYVDENQLGSVKVGEKTTLFVPSLNKEVNATVQMVAPAADFATKKATQELNSRDLRAFQVKLQVEDKDVRPGFTVEWHLKGAGARE